MTTFTVPNTIRIGKIQNQARMTVWGVVLTISHQYSWKMFRANFDDFSGPRWLGFTPETYQHCFGMQFLSFPVSMTKNYFSWFFTTFPGSTTTGAGPEQTKLKTGPGCLGFASETYTHFLGCRSYCSPTVRLRNVSVEFRWLFWAWAQANFIPMLLLIVWLS